MTEGYMCLTDWEWEIGNAPGGTRVYPSLTDIKNRCKCVDGCGIVKVRVELIEVVQEPAVESHPDYD